MDENRQLALLDNKQKPVTITRADTGLEINSAGVKKLVPYYNVLWVEASSDALTIDYVLDPIKSPAKVEKKTWVIPNEDFIELADGFASQTLERAYGSAKPRKSAYVLVNPNSGPGGAERKWKNEVKPLFEAARMKLDVVNLKRGGEATDLVEKMDIDKYDTIIACSGDGTPYEIFNGLAKRPDASKALSNIPVCQIPCGSGNAMALNLYGTNKPAGAALGVIKGIVTMLDLVSITQGPRRFVSFLSQSLGIIAESDLATEHMRWMGAKRFEVGMLSRIYKKKCYPCDLAIKAESVDKEDIKARYKRYMTESKHSETSADDGAANPGDEVDGHLGLPPLKYGTIQDELTDHDWELVPYDNIGNFYCGNMAYMSPDVNFFPAAMASDGCMDLVTIDGDIPTIKATKTLMAVEKGRFFELPHVMYRKISAYRIVPRDQKDGYISIDGERVPFEPFQAEIHRGLGRVLMKDGRFQAEGPRGWEQARVDGMGTMAAVTENGVNGSNGSTRETKVVAPEGGAH